MMCGCTPLGTGRRLAARIGASPQRTLTAALQMVLISLRAARTATAFTAWPRNAARAKVQTGAEVLAIVTATIVND